MKNKECGKCGGFNDINNNNKHSISFKSDASLRFHDVVWWLTKYFGKIVAATITFFHIFRQGHEVIRMRRQSRCHAPAAADGPGGVDKDR